MKRIHEILIDTISMSSLLSIGWFIMFFFGTNKNKQTISIVAVIIWILLFIVLFVALYYSNYKILTRIIKDETRN